MIKYILKLDYALSYWFSKSNKTIIPGVAFFFLNKVVFLLVTIILILDKIFPNTVDALTFSISTVIMSLFVMYYFQKPMERKVRNNKLDKEYSTIEEDEISKRRTLGLLLFIFSYLSIFIAVLF